MLESKSLGEKSRQKVPQNISKLLCKTIASVESLNFPVLKPHLSIESIQKQIAQIHPQWTKHFQLLEAEALHYFRTGQWVEASRLHQRIFLCGPQLLEINLHEFVISVLQNRWERAQYCLDSLLLTKNSLCLNFFMDLQKSIETKSISSVEIQALSIWNLEDFIIEYYQNRLTKKQKNTPFVSDEESANLILNTPSLPLGKKVAWLARYKTEFSSVDAYDFYLSIIYLKHKDNAIMEKTLTKILKRNAIDSRKWYQVWTPRKTFNVYLVKALLALATRIYLPQKDRKAVQQTIQVVKSHLKKFPRQSQLFEQELKFLEHGI
jgi:hypothetical protein